MLLVDVNVLVAAHRDDHVHADLIRGWWTDLLAGDEPFTVPAVVWASFLRLATSRRVFEAPTPLADAFAFIESVAAQPHHLLLAPGPRHLALLRRVCEEADASGDLVSDAMLAAIALEHDCAVASLDRDFARFASIEHVIPGKA